ncbi:hypothetical protein TYRP_022176 [Tyrophagus putrescentiae]|nr:hypothetical protein TYRP_022176 [Tyrophagus putrescentiae]
MSSDLHLDVSKLVQKKLPKRLVEGRVGGGGPFRVLPAFRPRSGYPSRFFKISRCGGGRSGLGRRGGGHAVLGRRALSV